MGNTRGHKDDTMLQSLQQSLPVLRKAAKLSQSDLASTLGVSRQTVVNWETGKTHLNPTQGLALMAVIQSFGGVYPGMGKIVEACLEQQNEAMIQAVKQRGPLEERIAAYIAGRIAANPKEESHDEDEQEVG